MVDDDHAEINISRDLTKNGISRAAASIRAFHAHGVCVSRKTLANMAWNPARYGDGPPYRIIAGVACYPVDLFDDWCERQIGPLVTCTAQRRHHDCEPVAVAAEAAA